MASPSVHAAAVSARAAAGTAVPAIRPFAFSGLHVGTDICHIRRIYVILAADSAKTPATAPRSPSRAARFVRRILSPLELPPVPLSTAATPSSLPPKPTSNQLLAWLLAGARSSSRSPSTGSTSAQTLRDDPLWSAASFLAGRFAAKEAVIKAHPHLDLTFHRIRIARTRHDEKNGSGPPVALVRISTPEDPNGSLLEQEARLSISHDGEYSTAVCLGFE